MILDGFKQVIDAGTLSREPCMKMKVSLVDIKLHEDAIHRGPAQVYPAVRDAIRGSVAGAGACLFEPIQTLFPIFTLLPRDTLSFKITLSPIVTFPPILTYLQRIRFLPTETLQRLHFLRN